MAWMGGGASDTVAPTVIITSTETSPTFAASIPLTITFSEPVTGFWVGDITVVGCTLGALGGSGAVYTVTATPTANVITVDIAAGVCVDAAGNANTAATQFSIVSASFNLLVHPDFSNVATLYQDAAKTTAVTADGQVIGAVTGVVDSTQATGANKPLYKAAIQNGLSMALGDAVSRLSTASIAHGIGTGDFYIATVIKTGVQSGAFYAICANGTEAPEFITRDNTLNNLGFYWAGTNRFTNTLSANTPYLIEYWRASGVMYAAVNGVQDATTIAKATSMANAAFTLINSAVAGSSGLTGHMGELLFYKVYSAALSAALRTSLNAKWAIF